MLTRSSGKRTHRCKSISAFARGRCGRHRSCLAPRARRN
jgi:hypothetical protein